jgi:hypothetical protein
MELHLASLHIWEIVDEMEEAPGLEANMKEQRDFKRRKKKTFGIISTNLDEANFAHVISYNDATNA